MSEECHAIDVKTKINFHSKELGILCELDKQTEMKTNKLSKQKETSE